MRLQARILFGRPIWSQFLCSHGLMSPQESLNFEAATMQLLSKPSVNQISSFGESKVLLAAWKSWRKWPSKIARHASVLSRPSPRCSTKDPTWLGPIRVRGPNHGESHTDTSDLPTSSIHRKEHTQSWNLGIRKPSQPTISEIRRISRFPVLQRSPEILQDSRFQIVSSKGQSIAQQAGTPVATLASEQTSDLRLSGAGVWLVPELISTAGIPKLKSMGLFSIWNCKFEVSIMTITITNISIMYVNKNHSTTVYHGILFITLLFNGLKTLCNHYVFPIANQKKLRQQRTDMKCLEAEVVTALLSASCFEPVKASIPWRFSSFHAL